MILTALELFSFRNHKKLNLSFSPDVTLIVGKNTAGKSNILEAITMLATGRSYKADRQQDVIAFTNELARIKGVTNGDTLELVVTKGSVLGKNAPRKKCLVNGVSKRVIDFAGKLKVVPFWPEDIRIITGSPSRRRKYLDSVLIQIDYEYRRSLQSYEKGLRQRNKLLEKIQEGQAEESQLLFWDKLLIKNGGYITDKRAEFIDYINTNKNHETVVLSSKKPFSLFYDKSIISRTRLDEYSREEILAKTTLVGPHRDDVQFIISHYVEALQDKQHSKLDTQNLNGNDLGGESSKNKNLAIYGSRGEQRMGILWLKLSELSFIHKMTNQRPILLLDDIFSELDTSHRSIVVSLITGQQSIITSANPRVLSDGIKVKMIQLP